MTQRNITKASQSSIGTINNFLTRYTKTGKIKWTRVGKYHRNQTAAVMTLNRKRKAIPATKGSIVFICKNIWKILLSVDNDYILRRKFLDSGDKAVRLKKTIFDSRNEEKMFWTKTIQHWRKRLVTLIFSGETHFVGQGYKYEYVRKSRSECIWPKRTKIV